MLILYYFYLEISARRAANELNLDYGVIHRKFTNYRKSIANYCNQEAKKLNGEIEIDEPYFLIALRKEEGSENLKIKEGIRYTEVFYENSSN